MTFRNLVPALLFIPSLAASLISSHSHGQYDFLAGTLAIGGLFVGPSLGQFYAGSYGPGSIGIGIRTTGGLMGLIGMATVIGSALDNMDGGGEPEADDSNQGLTLFLVGGITYLGGALYSLFDTGYAVRRQSDPRRPQRYGWTPDVSRTPAGDLKAGALARAHF
jgi:hypothetical protein